MTPFTITPEQAESLRDVLADHNDGNPVTIEAQGESRQPDGNGGFATDFGALTVGFTLATVRIELDGYADAN